jgi:diguanylate cyclase (GGDEF)-like protein
LKAKNDIFILLFLLSRSTAFTERYPLTEFLVFSCDPDGKILQFLQRDFEIGDALVPGSTWTATLDPESLPAAENFLDEILTNQSARLTLEPDHRDNAAVLELLGFLTQDVIHICAARLPNNRIAHPGNTSRPGNPAASPPPSASPTPISGGDPELDSQRLNHENMLQEKPGESSQTHSYKHQLIERILNATPDYLLISNLQTDQIILQNRPLEFLSSASNDNSAVGSHLIDPIIHPEDRGKLENYLHNLNSLKHSETTEIELRISIPDHEQQWFLRRDTVFSMNQDGSPEEILSLYQDITERQLAREKLYHLSTRDALTDLYNRVYFDQELDRLQESRLFPVSILIADVDGLKAINDALGHASGDRLIQRAAEVLRKAFRNEDVVSRIGGDEFGIILSRTTEEDLSTILARVQTVLDDFNADLNEIEIRLSVGHSTAQKGDQLLQTLREADLRMYSNKRDRKMIGMQSNSIS